MSASATTVAPLEARLRGRVLVGGLALVDQGLFALASFSVTILLARWLPTSQFGAFALAYFVFLLVAAAHTSLLTEPMLVFGGSIYRGRFRQYLSRLLELHAALALAMSAGFAIAGAILLRVDLGASHSMFAFALASPFVLLLWLLRRAFYVSFRPAVAAVGDGLYLVAVIAGIVALQRAGILSAARAIGVMGGAAIVASLLMLAVLRPARDGIGRREVAVRHWEYGRWSVVAQALFWSSGQVLMVLVPLVLGLGKLAVLAAAVNLYGPLNPLLQAAAALLLPSISSSAAGGGDLRALKRSLRRYNLALAGCVLLYALVLGLVGKPLMHHLYAGRYDRHLGLVLLFGLSYTASTVVQVQTVLLKATGHVKAVPLLWACSAALVLVLAVPAMLLGGLTGAVLVLIGSYVVAAAVAARKTRTLEVRL